MKLPINYPSSNLVWAQISFYDEKLGSVNLPQLPEYFHTIGTYIIRMPLINRYYVGSSSHVYSRLREHRTILCRGKHPQKKFQQLFDISNTLEAVVFKTNTIEESKALEQKLLDLNATDPNMINVSINVKKPGLGLFPSEEVKQKIRLSMINKPKTETHRKNMSIARSGKPLSPQHAEKVRKLRLGSKVSDITKQKMSMSRTGKLHNTNTKERMSEIAISRWKNNEFKNKMKEVFINKQMPDDFLIKLKERLKGNTYFLGKKHSNETKDFLRKINIGRKINPNSIEKMKETKIRNNKLRQKDGYIFPKSKPIIVNGKYYTSSNSASIDLKIDSETVRKRVLNPNPKFAEWKYA